MRHDRCAPFVFVRRRMTRVQRAIGTLGLWVAAAAPAWGFEARVVLPDGTPAKRATVSVLGRSGSVATDDDGRFRWTPDPPVPFGVVVVLAEGTCMAPVIVESLEGGVLELRPETLTDSVAVTAEAAPETSAPRGSALALIPRERIEEIRPAHLSDLLESVPGAAASSRAHDAVPSLRGMARGRTIVLLDGARVTTERRAGASAGFLDPFFLERVEIARGPGSVAYGSDAIGGVVHARTRRPAPGSPFGLRFVGTAGEGVDERGLGLEVSQGFERGGILFQARRREFEDYESPDGVVLDSGAEDRGFLLRGAIEAGSGLFEAGYQDDRAENVGKPSTDAPARRIRYPEEASRRLTLDWDGPLGKAERRLRVHGFLGGYRLVTEQRRFDDAGIQESAAIADVDASDYGVRASYRALGTEHAFEAGIDLNGRFGLHAVDQARLYAPDGSTTFESVNVSIEDASRQDTAAYGTYEARPLSWLGLETGIRVDRIGTRNSGGSFGDRSTSHTALSGYVTLNWLLPKAFELSTQVARGFRDPSLSDRYFVGPSGRGIVTGNPDLEPEQSLQFDLSIRRNAPRVAWAAHAFRYRIDDIIVRYEPVPDAFTFQNQGRAFVHGAELEVRANLPRGSALEAGIQYLRGATEDDGVPLADIPPAGLSVGYRKAFGETGYFGVRAAGYLRDERPGPSEQVTPGYATFDLQGGAVFARYLELRVNLRNLFDQKYLAGADEKAVLAPGRSVALTLVVKLPRGK